MGTAGDGGNHKKISPKIETSHVKNGYIAPVVIFKELAQFQGRIFNFRQRIAH
jgi:hypothetical protein